MRKVKYLYILIILFSTYHVLYSIENDSLRNYYLGELIVSGDKEAITESASINEPDRTFINDFGVFNANELFSRQAGMRFRIDSRNESIIYLRGFDQRQVSIFIDGMPISFGYNGLVDLNQFSTANISKLTATKSMPSVLYGPNSMGGTVNLITEGSMEKNSSYFELSGSKDLYRGMFSHLGSNESFYWAVIGNYSKSEIFETSNNYPLSRLANSKISSSDYMNSGIFLKSGYQFNQNNEVAISYNFQKNSKSVPVNIFTSRARFWKFPEINSNLINIIFNSGQNELLDFRANLYYQQFYNKLESFDDSTFTTQNQKYSFNSLHKDYAIGGGLITKIKTGYIYPLNLSINFKNDIHKEIDNTGLQEEEYSANVISISAEQSFELSPGLGAVTGINYDLLNPTNANGEELRGNDNTVNAHLGINYNITDDFTIYTHISKKGRFPTLKELYSDILGKDLPNPDLSSEKTINYEIGMNLEESSYLAKVSIFYNDITDLIQLQFLDDGNRLFKNIGKAEFYGFEASIGKNFRFVDAVLNYTYLISKNKSEGRENDNLEYRPEHSFNLILKNNYKIGFGWVFDLNYTGKQYGVFSDTREWMELDPYILLNMKLSQNIFNDIELFFRLDNITDTYYESEYGFPQIGRHFLAGIGLTL